MYELKALTQEVWEDTFNKKEIRSRILRKLNENTEIKEILLNASKAVNNHYMDNYYDWYESKQNNWDELVREQTLNESIIIQMFILITLNKYTNIQTIVGQMAGMLDTLQMIPAIKTLSEVLVVIADKTDLWNVITPSESDEGVIMVEANYVFDEDILQYISNTKYLPPMLVRPKMIESNYDYDYLTVQSSKILGAANHHSMPIALDVLNIMNGTKLKLDTFMLKFEENPNKPLNTVEKVEQFNRMSKASREVYQHIMDTGNEFYLTYKYDKRGRMYSQGYHINIQSTDYKKSLVSLAQGELLDNF